MASDFTVEDKMWLKIICSRVSPLSNVFDVLLLQGRMISCLFEGIPINVGHYIMNDLKEYLYQDISTLMFPFLITKLC